MKWSLGGNTVVVSKKSAPCMFQKSPGDPRVPAKTPQQMLGDDGSRPPIANIAPRIAASPPFTGSGAAAAANAAAFVDWVTSSVRSQAAEARSKILAAGDNSDLANALIDQFNAARNSPEPDDSHALMVLAVLGEMHSHVGEAFLTSFIDEPPPTTEHVIDHYGPIEEIKLDELQAMAADGLANQGTQSANAKLMNVIASHRSSAVRLEAIRAYKLHHLDTYRDDLAQLVHDDERWVFDQILNAGDPATLDARLASFEAAHPELAPVRETMAP